jgi:hypothetical protein
MNFIEKLIEGKLEDAKDILFLRLEEFAINKLNEEKKLTSLVEAPVRRNTNIIRMGRIQKIRRRIRRNSKGRIVVQRNVKKSAMKGYRVSGSTVKRIPATVRLRKARLLKRSWKTTRRAKLRRTLLKRKMSMRRRASMGLR